MGEGAVAKRRRMRGLSPRREPLIRRFAPPSPTRGEGKPPYSCSTPLAFTSCDHFFSSLSMKFA
ncbi:hypothetical protein GWE18_23405 [Bradyrhizobium sp. CSA112]|nr:hypothetical protein [Bradyrhizobium sp. CSA112]